MKAKPIKATIMAVGICAAVLSARANSIYEIGSCNSGSDDTSCLTTLINDFNNGRTGNLGGLQNITVDPGSYLCGITGLSTTSIANCGQNSESAANNCQVPVSSGTCYVLLKWGDCDEVYYVGNCTGSVTLCNDTGDDNGASHCDLFSCSGGPSYVPDGGSTVMLLGSVMTVLGLLRRKISRR